MVLIIFVNCDDGYTHDAFVGFVNKLYPDARLVSSLVFDDFDKPGKLCEKFIFNTNITNNFNRLYSNEYVYELRFIWRKENGHQKKFYKVKEELT